MALHDEAWIEGSCLCGNVTFSIRKPPAKNDPEVAAAQAGFRELAHGDAWAMTYCHCDSCRTSSGAIFQPYICIPKTFLRFPQNQTLETHAGVAVYNSTPGRCERLFCKTCSAPLFYTFDEFPKLIEVAPMALDKAKVHRNVALLGHFNVGDTVDKTGGFIDLRKWKEPGIAQKLGGFKSEDVTFGDGGSRDEDDEEHGGSLRGRCHCGAVRYTVNVEGRVNGLSCHCETCRKWTSGLFWPSITAPKAALVIEEGSDKLAEFKSSDHATRRHCGVCFSSLFYESTKRPNQVTVGIATLDKEQVAEFVDEGWHVHRQKLTEGRW